MAMAMTVSQPVAAVDQVAPAPPTGLQAVDRADDDGGHIVLHWVPSPDAEIRQVGLGAASFVTVTGAHAFHREARMDGYRVYRWRDDEDPQLVAVLPSVATEYVDSTATDHVRYRYEVRAFDGAGESMAMITPGSGEDTARTAAAVDNHFVPADAEGRPVLGWFDRSDRRVDLNDFFLFADHFGRVEGELLYDSQYDLDRNRRVDFDDFFLFADHFGREIVNVPPLDD